MLGEGSAVQVMVVTMFPPGSRRGTPSNVSPVSGSLSSMRARALFRTMGSLPSPGLLTSSPSAFAASECSAHGKAEELGEAVAAAAEVAGLLA